MSICLADGCKHAVMKIEACKIKTDGIYMKTRQWLRADRFSPAQMRNLTITARLYKMKLELDIIRFEQSLKIRSNYKSEAHLWLVFGHFAGVCWSELWKYTEHKMRSPHCRATQLPTGTRFPLPTLSTIGWCLVTWRPSHSRERAKLPANFRR